MKVFWSAEHEGHVPRWYVADGTVRPCPDDPARVGRILGALGAAGHEIVEVEGVVGSAGMEPALREGNVPNMLRGPILSMAHKVHKADYLEYLETIHGLWVAEFGAGVDVIPDTFVRRAEEMRRPGKPAAQAGYYCFDMAAPITAGTFEAAVGAARCAESAARAVLGGERFAYALCRPPGHHAGADYCGGFCYLNNAAVAAEVLRGGGKRRVAIFDIDYHHGNGTQDIFYARADVLFVSIHAEPETQYPYFWGHAEETGVGEGAGFNVNNPLARGTGEGEWMKAFERGLERIAGYMPEACVVSLGVDTFEGDTVGDFGVTMPGFGEIGRRLAALGVPAVVVQEGGYNLEAVGECVGAVLGGLADGGS